jgi:Planctomycete cytochrome C.
MAAWLAVMACSADAAVDFAKEVAPLLEQHCLACHSAAKSAGGLAIVSRESVISRKAVVPGKAEPARFTCAPLFRREAEGPCLPAVRAWPTRNSRC